MFRKIRMFFNHRKLKKLVTEATTLIYSGQKNLNELLQREFIKDKRGYDLLISYLAIKVSAELLIPVDQRDIENAYEDLCTYEINTPEQFGNMIDLLKAKAELSVLKKEWDLELDRNCYELDNYSLRGMMYWMITRKRRPLTIKEREYVKESYNNIRISKDKVEALRKEEESQNSNQE